jgi:hypothetical protein
MPDGKMAFLIIPSGIFLSDGRGGDQRRDTETYF